MKCPKCHYLSFDPEPRCRNCGYTLSLDPDLEIHGPAIETAAPLADLALRDFDNAETLDTEHEPPASPPRRAPAPPQVDTERRVRTTTPGPFDEMLEAATRTTVESPVTAAVPPSPLPEAPRVASATPARTESRVTRVAPPATTELPLFVQGIGRDNAEVAPLPAPERVEIGDARVGTPVIATAERKAAPDTPSRPRVGKTGAQRPFGPLDHDLLEGLQEIELAEQRHARSESRRERQADAADARSRLSAAVVDAALLAILATGLVSVTLRWAGLDWGQMQVLPVAPLAGFILVIATGYLFMFTAASGQTVGKMLLGIRVVDAGASGAGLEPLSVRQALYRETLTIPSVLLLGIGFLPAMTLDGRAVHDRLTQTRVVRA